MEDVLTAMAYSSVKEEALARVVLWMIGRGYPKPMTLDVEPQASVTRFLEMEVVTHGKWLYTRFYNKALAALLSGSTTARRLADVDSGTTRQVRQTVVVGTLHQILAGCTFFDDVVMGVLNFGLEMLLAGWPIARLREAVFKLADSGD